MARPSVTGGAQLIRAWVRLWRLLEQLAPVPGGAQLGETNRSRPYQPALRQARIRNMETTIMAGLTPAVPANTNEKFRSRPGRP